MKNYEIVFQEVRNITVVYGGILKVINEMNPPSKTDNTPSLIVDESLNPDFYFHFKKNFIITSMEIGNTIEILFVVRIFDNNLSDTILYELKNKIWETANSKIIEAKLDYIGNFGLEPVDSWSISRVSI